MCQKWLTSGNTLFDHWSTIKRSFLSFLLPSCWLQNFNSTSSAVGHEQCEDFGCLVFFVFFHSCRILLPSPPTPSLPRSNAPSRTPLKAPKSAGLWIYWLHAHDCSTSKRSNTHNRISFNWNRPKGCWFTINCPALACSVRFMSNIDITEGERDAKRSHIET